MNERDESKKKLNRQIKRPGKSNFSPNRKAKEIAKFRPICLNNKAHWPQAHFNCVHSQTVGPKRKPQQCRLSQSQTGKSVQTKEKKTHPWIDRILNETDPSFECGHLQQTEISLDDVVKIYRRVCPFIVFINACSTIGHKIDAQSCLISINALRRHTAHQSDIGRHWSFVVVFDDDAQRSCGFDSKGEIAENISSWEKHLCVRTLAANSGQFCVRYFCVRSRLFLMVFTQRSWCLGLQPNAQKKLLTITILSAYPVEI